MSQLAAPRTPTPGRDLPVAVAVGLGLLAVVVASLFIRKEAFGVLAVILVCGAMWELARAFTRRDVHLPLVPLLVGSVGILVSAYTAGPEALIVAFVLTVGGAVVWRVLDGSGRPALRDSTAAAFATAYLPFLAGFAMLMLAQPDGPSRTLVFVLLAVASDVGGYTVGVLLGRHPLAPSVSPKKSWEGLAGSVVLACVGVVVAQVIPTLIEYQAILKAANKAKEGTTVPEVRAIFDRAQAIDDFQAVAGKDLEVRKDGDKVVVAFAYDKEIHLFGPAYLLLKYKGQSN